MEDSFKIIVFTPEKEVVNEAKKINLLFESGISFLHIRKPSFSREQTASLINQIDERFHSRLKLHDYPELALNFGTGFQVNSRNRDIDQISKLSASCHTLEEINQAKGMEYVTLSPIYDSISKEGYNSKFNVSGLNFSDCPVQVIALGGVTAGRIKELADAGFKGAAFLGSVWKNEESFYDFVKFMKMRNVSFQFITDGKNVEETVSQARKAIEGGCRWIQIRMKNSSAEELHQAAIKISPLAKKVAATLIVDDNIEIAMTPEIDGIHLGQHDMEITKAREILGKGKIIGLTINNISHLDKPGCSTADYFGIGPFRFTATKKNLAPELGIEGYRKIISKMEEIGLTRQFVAIGGIKTSDVPILMSNGVPGIAVSGAIGKAADPVSVTQNFISQLKHFTK